MQHIDDTTQFQSTLPRGERPAVWKNPKESLRFQSTLPRGERRNLHALSSRSGNFNPRSHEGSDRSVLIRQVGKYAFQSTLPRGERPTSRYRLNYSFGFQSTLPRGERLLTSRILLPRIRFQSTLPRGERHTPFTKRSGTIPDFNPRSHEGSDWNPGRI